MKKAQGSLEYLIIIAAVIAIAAIVILFLSSALQTQADSSTISKCKQAASTCKVELSTSAGSNCPYCYEQCVNKEGYEIFPGAYNFCLLGQPEKVYAGSVDTESPSVSYLKAEPFENGAIITWSTNEPADSTVIYALCKENIENTDDDCTNQNVFDELVSETNAISENELVFEHDVTISGLISNSKYFYMTKSVDGSSLVGYSEVLEFITP